MGRVVCMVTKHWVGCGAPLGGHDRAEPASVAEHTTFDGRGEGDVWLLCAAVQMQPSDTTGDLLGGPWHN